MTPKLPIGLLAAVLLALSAGPALAQTLNYDAGNAQNLAGTYQDLGAAGAAIATANTDDADSAPQPLGFAFDYNGATFTQFILSTNSFLKLGSSPLSDPFLYLEYAQNEVVNGQTLFPGGPVASTDPRSENILAPFATDLRAGTSPGGTEYRAATTGTAPNRVCTVQWKNVQDKPRPTNAANAALIGTQYGSCSFQVRIYETSGQIDFVYGPAVAGPGPDAYRTVAVGIKGSDPQPGGVVMADKSSAGAWGAALFRGDYYAGGAGGGDPHNVRSTVLPDAGRTYRFRASAPQDAAVQQVYTLGQLPVGTPHAVRAAVRNAGTQPLLNLPVRLDVSGPGGFAYVSTQTVGRLAPGASTTVVFPAYTSGTRLGDNTVAVSVLPDAYPQTDQRVVRQVLTANTTGYIGPLPLPGFTSSRYGYDVREGITAVRYDAPRATALLAVTDFVPASSNSAGRTIYALATDLAGNLLARTPDYVVQAADLNTTVSFPFVAPVPLAAGGFLVGIAQVASPVAHYPVGALFEAPTRAGAFFFRNSLVGGPFTDDAPRGNGPFAIQAILRNTVLGAAAPAAPDGLALRLWPNPARGTATLAVPAATGAARPVQVFDALGRAVRRATVAAGAVAATVDVAGLPAGVYVVRCGAAAGRLVVAD